VAVESGLTYRDVLRLAAVSPLLGSALLSRLAGEIFTLAIVLHVLDRFGSPALVGWVVAAAFIPGLVVSPIAGAILDRYGPARGIAADLAASAGFVAAIALVEVRGTGGATVLMVLAAAYSLARPLSLAGFRALIPRLVPEPGRDRANAIDVGTFNLVEVAGPALAGVLFSLTGGRVTLLIVAALYAASAVALLPVLARRVPPGARTPLLPAALGAVSYVARHPVLRGLAVSYSLYAVAWGVLVVGIPLAVVDAAAGEVRDGGTQVGVVWAVLGVAGGLGALVAGRLRTAGRERVFIGIGIAVTAVAVYPLIGHGGMVGLMIGLVVVGLVSGGVNVSVLTLRQRRTDPAWLGRVIAVSISVNLLGTPVGAALGGWLADRSLPMAFAAGGTAAALGALAALLLIPRERPAPPIALDP
jgi:MFS family permease